MASPRLSEYPFTLEDKDAIQKTAHEVVSREDYDLSTNELDLSWLESIFNALISFFKDINHFFESLYLVSPILSFGIIILLFAILALLVWHIIYSFRSAWNVHRNKTSLATENVDAAKGHKSWEARANRAARQKDYLLALRCLFHASLLRLDTARGQSFRRAATNREYLRKYSSSPAHPALKSFVNLIDLKYYGGGTCDENDYQAGRHAYNSVVKFTKQIEKKAPQIKKHPLAGMGVDI